MNLKTGAILAVKRIELYEHSEEEISALMHEVALLEQLNSPFIVRYEGFARSDTHLSIATEYIEGGSLLNAIRTFGPFPEDLAALHAYSILEGLDYLHGQDIAHCDLKSANVLIAKDGHLHLSDFGISLRLGGQTTLRRAIRGTPNWLAPEIVTLRGTSKASDIWSFACTVLEMLQGTPPYANQNPMSVLYSIVERGCPPFPDGLSSDLTNLLKSCFAVEPRARPTAGELKKHPWFERSNGMAEKPLFKYSAGTPWTCFDDPMTIVPSRGEGGEFRGPRHGATLSLGTQSHAQDRTSDNSSSQLRPPTEKLLRCCPAYRVQIRRRASQRVVQECCVM
jgi:serine/threonine protein kinase